MKGAGGTRAQAGAKSPASPAPARTSAQPHAPTTEAFGPGRLSSLTSGLSGGAPLPASTRERLEAGFATSLGDVRVHTGGAAALATAQVQAEAFATGRDIAFAPGRYNPGTAAGDHLIAEEVAHVIQQRGSGGQVMQRHALISGASDSAELSARAAADNIAAGKPAQLSLSGLSTRGRIMRRARAGAVAASPVVASPTGILGTTRAGPAPILTPAMTSTLSPAGGKLVDSAGRKAPPKQRGGTGAQAAAKAPDEAQTAQAESSPAPPGVMTAGAPAGATAGATTAAKALRPADAAAAAGRKKPAERGKKEKDRKDKPPGKESEKKRGKQGKAEGRGGTGSARAGARARAGAGAGRGTFGQVKGDRGAEAARAARRRLDQRAEALATNEGAEARIDSALAAAAPPPNAAEAAGQTAQTQTLERAQVPAGDPEAARSASRAAVARATPGTIEDLENFAGPGGASRRRPLADSVAAQARKQTGQVRASLDAVNSPPRGPEPPPPVPQPAPLPAPASPDPALAQAVPPPVNEEALDATEFKAEADARLAEHDVDDETLNKADEGPLRAIGNQKTRLNENVDSAANRVRTAEAQARDTARGALAGAEAGTEARMEARRQSGQTEVSTEQDHARTGEERGEQTLADQITATYRTAQTEVNRKLASLTTDAVRSFRDRQNARLESFASGVRSDLAALKRRRYAGVRGALRRARDWLLSINSVPEVKRLYERHRNQYIADIDALIAQIKADIDATIKGCKATLRTARERIEQLVAENRGRLDADAQAALTRAQQGFAQMQTRIDQAAEAARRALDAERERAIQAVDAELERIRSENAGLVDRIAGAIAALAAALGQFMRLMARITRMGVGTFLSAALSQAVDGLRNHLWGQLQEAFKQWLFMKLPVLQLLLSLPPNWYEMLTALATNMIGLFTENLPSLLPAIGTAAAIWLATTIAAKLIPGAGAIMAVIDAIRGAYALVQSLFSAASAFFSFVMEVANRGNGAVAFARAVAFGIVAALDAVLTFLGVDRLIARVVGAIARPFGRIVRRIMSRFRAFMNRRRRRRRQRRTGRREAAGGDANRLRSARARARQQSRARRRRRAQRQRQRDRRGRGRERTRRESAADRRRRRQRERERRQRERLARARREIPPKVRRLVRRGLPQLVLRARLAIWRLTYRLSVLRARVSGKQVMIEARVNPGHVWVGGIRFSRDDLLIEVRKIAQQVARDRRAQAAARRIQQSRGQTPTSRRADGSQRHALVTNVGENNLVGLHVLHRRDPHRGMGAYEYVNLGAVGAPGPGGGTQFRRQQGWGGTPNQWVRDERNRMARYDQLLEAVRSRPIHHGEAMRRMLQRYGGPVGGADMGRATEHLGIRLQEAHRSQAMLAHLPMEMALLQRGDAETAIRAHPAYGAGSQRRMQDVDRYLARRGGLGPDDPEWSQARRPTGRHPAIDATTRAQIEREANYIAAAIDAQRLVFSSRAEAIAHIRRMVFNAFGMGLPNPGGPIAL